MIQISRGLRRASSSFRFKCSVSGARGSMPSMLQAISDPHQQYSHQTVRTFHFSAPMGDVASKDLDQPKPSEKANETDEDDVVPVWQNPLHHNDPEMAKMFPEDFEEGEEMPAIPLPPLEGDDPNKVLAPPHIHALAHEVVQLSLLEMRELTEKIAEHFDFDDNMMASSYAGGAVAGSGAPAEEEVVEEKSLFDLKLVGFDAKKKIKVIKEVRAIAGLGLKEAKEMVEGAPKVIQKELSQEKADELKAQLEAVGAEIEIV